MNRILHIDASGRNSGSVSRQLSARLVTSLADDSGLVTYRDISQGLPFVNETMIGAYFTPESERTAEQRESIELSNSIVQELRDADTIIIGIPIYNFSMPASFKAWADQAARVGETFKYTENGPIGLLKNKKAHVVIASGGTRVGSEIDFLSPWLRHFLGFIGISDVEIINADTLNQRGDEAVEDALNQIAALAA